MFLMRALLNGVGVRVEVAVGPTGVAVRVGVRVGPTAVAVRVGVRVGVAVLVGVEVGPPRLNDQHWLVDAYSFERK